MARYRLIEPHYHLGSIALFELGPTKQRMRPFDQRLTLTDLGLDKRELH